MRASSRRPATRRQNTGSSWMRFPEADGIRADQTFKLREAWTHMLNGGDLAAR